ncbi:MAG: regulator [Acidobacteriota bacterium]
MKNKALTIIMAASSAVAVFVAVLLPNEAPVSAAGPVLASVPASEPSPTPAATTTRSDAPQQETALPVVPEWESFTVSDGLPSNKVFCVRTNGPRVWAGTDTGLALYEKGRWTVIGVKEGLPHRAVLSVDVSPQTGDVWVGTMGGLARITAGRIDTFTQTNSGLSNNFVHEVQCDPEENVVWAATAMGLSRFDVASHTWQVYTQENTPMHEPWTYSVAVDRGMVYVGAWGGGILEYTKSLNRWREYRDPDKEMEIDLLPNDGPVHDVTSAVDFAGGVLWQGTYMGMARYDGRQWWSYYKEDSGLPSNFINFIRAQGRLAWICTDSGLAVSNGRAWVTYQGAGTKGGQILFIDGKQIQRRLSAKSLYPHNFVLGMDFQGRDVWVATEGGVGHGRVDPALGFEVEKAVPAGKSKSDAAE